MKDYIKSLKIPPYHRISFNGDRLRLTYEDLYLQGSTVFSRSDQSRVIDIKKFKLNEESVRNIIDRFIENANERMQTKPYQMKLLNDTIFLSDLRPDYKHKRSYIQRISEKTSSENTTISLPSEETVLSVDNKKKLIRERLIKDGII